jgi:radical SAM superfamily enzyme
MMLETISYLNQIPIDGIKLQLLHVLEHTDLARYYREHPFHLPDLNEYLETLSLLLSKLRPDIVVHRITGDGPKNILIDPKWTGNKRLVLNSIQKYFKDNDIWQGKEYSCQNHLHSTN